MKVRLYLKDPDGCYEGFKESAVESVKAVTGLTPKERECLVIERAERMAEQLSDWVKYGEYVGVEFDIADDGTISGRVCKDSEFNT